MYVKWRGKKGKTKAGGGGRLDKTEIHGFDNLHHAQGILREAQGAYSPNGQSGRQFFIW